VLAPDRANRGFHFAAHGVTAALDALASCSNVHPSVMPVLVVDAYSLGGALSPSFVSRTPFCSLLDTVVPMPEMVEIEIYRRLATRLVGRTIASTDANDAWFCKRTTTPEMLIATLIGGTICGARRIGKLLLLDIQGEAKTSASVFAPNPSELGGSAPIVLGLRFGMTGRLIVDGTAGIDELLYSSGRDDPAWDRFGLCFTDGTTMSIRDPRRLGGVELDPDISLLGVDALMITRKELRVLTTRLAPIKAILLDQAFIAGLGNLLVDEVLWRCDLAPNRAGTSIAEDELRLLHKTIQLTVGTMLERGGSHLGDVIEERHVNGRCPLDGAPMIKGTFGGRSSWWCSQHQV
jgi:formamidopyrimidine-DNA glycosylase